MSCTKPRLAKGVTGENHLPDSIQFRILYFGEAGRGVSRLSLLPLLPATFGSTTEGFEWDRLSCFQYLTVLLG